MKLGNSSGAKGSREMDEEEKGCLRTTIRQRQWWQRLYALKTPIGKKQASGTSHMVAAHR
jgi:hypothetical protein